MRSAPHDQRRANDLDLPSQVPNAVGISIGISMYQNAALLALFLLVYSAVAGRVERSWVSGPIVFTSVGLREHQKPWEVGSLGE
jgi:hypothetical protein